LVQTLRDHGFLRRCALPFLRHRIGGRLPGLRVELGEPGLIHHGEPEIAVRIGVNLQRAFRLLGLKGRDFEFLRLAGRGIERADELRAEIREPDLAVLGHDDVVRLHRAARQIVFRDDDLGRAALRTRQRLHGIGVLFLGREIGAREQLGGGLDDRRIDARTFAARTWQQRLRRIRRRARRIAAHALEDVREIIGRIFGADDAVQRVAAGAIGEEVLQLLVAGHGHDPFGVGHLRAEVLRRRERDVDRLAAFAQR
jgi:hypothetical protein